MISGLIFARMCRFFAHYGVRTLLVLYLIDVLSFSDARAFSVNAVFVTLFELGAIFGGILADRLLGFRRALLLGGALLTLGYTSLMWEGSLVLSFGLLIMGGNLLVSNIPALIGKLTKGDDKKQKKTLTLLYAMQNLGALISIPLLGILKDYYGYKVAFCVAGGVMFLGLLTLICLKLPQDKKEGKSFLPVLGYLAMPGVAALLLSSDKLTSPGIILLGIVLGAYFGWKVFASDMVLKEKRGKFCIALLAIIIFFSVEDQLATSLIVYADKVCNRDVFGITLPSSLVGMLNPVVIILFSPLFAKKKNRIVLPFFATAMAMLLLSLVQAPSILLVLAVVVVISLSELYIGPLVFQIAAESSCEEKRGEVMGIVPVAFCLSFILSSMLSKLTIAKDGANQVVAFASGFSKMSLLLLIALALFGVKSFVTRYKEKQKALT